MFTTKVKRRVATAAAVVGLMGAAAPIVASAPASAASMTCSTTSAMVLQWGITQVSGTGTVNCRTSSSRQGICLNTSLVYNGRTVAQRTTCRTGSGSITSATPIVGRSGPMSGYRVYLSSFASV